MTSLLLALIVVFAVPSQDAGPVQAVEVSGAWLRAAQPKQVTGGYVLLENRSASAVALTAVRSPIAKTIELHSMSERDGVMRMVQVARITIPARGKVALEPGGYHLMLFELTRALKPGDRVTLTLVFDSGREVDATFEVKARDA